jgi:hypothetical protein
VNDADILAEWSERAAIMQYDGGLLVARAEFMAAKDIQRRLGLPKVPEVISVAIRERQEHVGKMVDAREVNR